MATLLLCISGGLYAEPLVLQDVRYWTQNGVTRVAVQLTGQTEVRRDRLNKPERYFFDFQNTAPTRRGLQTIAVNDSLVRQIRIAEAKPGVARVVLDLIGNADVTTSELSNPYRLMIEVRTPGSTAPTSPAEPVITSAAPAVPVPAPTARMQSGKSVRAFVPPRSRSHLLLAAAVLRTPPVLQFLNSRKSSLPSAPKVSLPSRWRAPVTTARRTAEPLAPPAPAVAAKQTVVETAHVTPPAPVAPSAATPTTTAPPAHAARRGASGANSMTRALGLKIRRVVLDPGHGGHDQGSSGPTGLLEKELVLDVALRLGELITANLGSEVVYTRDDDHFVPLETRTKIANDSRADLFVSIHANSSVIRSVSGVETYFLSFTSSKEALDVAARENATSNRSVFELRDLLQKIALQEKVEESRDFATRVNASLYRVWGPANTAARNRGVKKAPFVVLIGASMPSILTEIGFLSNPHDEKELKKPETRQKIADALYKGIAQYAESLSHFAVARRSNDE